MSDVMLETERCQGQWTDAEHSALPAEYELQFPRREVNGALPLRLCGRCVAEYRASMDVLWVRSL